MKKQLSILFFVCLSFASWSQLQVSDTMNTRELAEYLAGTGVSISNVRCNCDTTITKAIGNFDGVSSNLGIREGILLTTGSIYGSVGSGTTVTGINDAGNITYNNSGLGTDSELDPLTGQPLYDICYLMFDLTVTGDSLYFRYVFGSEEYPEYVCSPFDDVFGFFISGPGITGWQNLAIVPGTTTLPVSINAINSGTPGSGYPVSGCSAPTGSLSYSALYVNNNGPVPASPSYPIAGTSVQYDGFTTVLTASKGGLTPCSTYTLKLAIADATDGNFDSGVFLKARSLNSPTVLMTPTTNRPDPLNDTIIEGCYSGQFDFHLTIPQGDTQTYNLQWVGTTTSGADYIPPPTTVVFPPHDTLETISIGTLYDGITEPLETIVIRLMANCGTTVLDSAIIYVQDTVLNSVIDAQPDTACIGDTIQLDFYGGLIYDWGPGYLLSDSTIFNPYSILNSTQQFWASSQLGICVVYDTITVYADSSVVIDLTDDTITCGVPIGLVANALGTPLTAAGFNYSWSPPTNLSSTSIANPLATPVATTTYTVTIGNARCPMSADVTITVDSLDFTIEDTAVSCPTYSNGSARIIPAPGPALSYLWPGGETTAYVNGLAAGTYNVTVSSVTCAAIATVVIGTTDSIAFSNSVTDVNCFGQNNGAISLSGFSGGSGNIGFLWSDGNTDTSRTALTAGTYSLTISDISGGCQQFYSYTISEPALLDVSVTGFTDAGCFGDTNGSINISVTGGTTAYTYSWNSGAYTTANVSNLAAGIYHLVVTDAHGCMDSLDQAVNSTSDYTINTFSDSTSCFGYNDGTAWLSVTVSSGSSIFTYLWSTGSTNDTITNLAAGSYTLTVTDSAGCANNAIVRIEQPDSMRIYSHMKNVSCNGLSDGAIYVDSIDGIGPFNLMWGSGATTDSITGLAPGNYILTITDGNGCIQGRQFTVVQNPGLSIQMYHDDVSCYGAADAFAATRVSGGTATYTYLWNTSSVNDSLFNLGPGTYTVTATDGMGCVIYDSVIITEPTELMMSFIADSTSCPGNTDGSITISASGGSPSYVYILNGGTAQTNGDFTSLAPGSYTIVVRDSRSCSDTALTAIYEPPALILSVSPNDTTIQSGDAVQVNSDLGVYTEAQLSDMVWIPSEGLSCSYCTEPRITPQQPSNTYILVVTYNDVCVVTDTIHIIVKPGDILVPTAFSPNGDGFQDLFRAFPTKSIDLTEMLIYNRWGEKVFSYPDKAIHPEWDGVYKSTDQALGVYIYVITGKDKFSGEKIVVSGNLTLLR